MQNQLFCCILKVFKLPNLPPFFFVLSCRLLTNRAIGVIFHLLRNGAGSISGKIRSAGEKVRQIKRKRLSKGQKEQNNAQKGTVR
jgi:hypothetical protein